MTDHDHHWTPEFPTTTDVRHDSHDRETHRVVEILVACDCGEVRFAIRDSSDNWEVQ